MTLMIFMITDVIHFIKIAILCEMVFRFNKRKKINDKVIFLAGIITVSIISVCACDYKYALFLLYMLLIFLWMRISYTEKVLTIGISSIWIVFMMSILDIMTTVLFDTIANIVGINLGDFNRIGASIISLILVLTLGKIYIKKYDEGIKSIRVVNLALYTILSIVDTYVVMVMSITKIDEQFSELRFLYSIAFIFVIIGIFIQLGAVILLFMQRNVYKEKEQLTEKYLNEQINHYEYLEIRETETKKFRHDMRSHMQMLSSLARGGEYDKIDEYIGEMNVRLERFGNLVTVQNGIVDAVVNQYYSNAIQNRIDMEVKGIFPKECCIDAYDLCTIFSNVLSNAYEATIKAQEKKIILECRYNEKKIIFTVTNTYKNEGQFEGDKFITSKEDIDYHGYGLINIRESVKKYNGVLDIEITNSEFSVTISLNNKEKRDYENSSNR